MALIDLKNCVVKIKDGTGTPLEITLKIAEGTLEYTETRNIEYVKDRGKLDDVVLGDEEPMDVSLDVKWDFLKGDGTATPEDALKQRNDASSWVSTDPDTCAPYCVDIEITHTPICTSTKDEVITLEEFRYETLQHDLNGATLSVQGKCNKVEATLARNAQV